MTTPCSPSAAPAASELSPPDVSGPGAVAPGLRIFRPEKTIPPRDAPSSEAIRWRVSAARAAGGAVDLEIGCGVGWHPIRYAAEHPERLLFAIEHTAEKFGKFRERLKRNTPLANLIPVHADAVAWLAHAGREAEFDRVFFLYPNPNPKNPAGRWIRMPFFGYLVDRLAPRGTIVFRTNSAAYAEEVAREAARWGLVVAAERAFVLAEAGEPRTHFERKYLERGETCREVTLARA